jgi:DNA topoisomerase I
MKNGTTVVSRLQARGIRRRKKGDGVFAYRGAGGAVVSSETLRRVKELGIPPAWRDVAINANAGGRVQAVGRDAAGRWQYRYHPSHTARQARQKFERMAAFMRALPALRRHVSAALAGDDLCEDRVLSGILRILLKCFQRPGSAVYAEENGSFGIVTLRRQHVSVRGNEVHLDFPGKSGKQQTRVLKDRAVARLLRQLLDVPGRQVFKFEGCGEIANVRRRRLNAYIKEVMGQRFSAKDFRTWAGTVLCARALARAASQPPKGKTPKTRAEAAVREAIRETAAQLGNTPAVCRASYVAPALLDSYRRCGDPNSWLGGALRNGHAACSSAKLERILVRALANGSSKRRQ